MRHSLPHAPIKQNRSLQKFVCPHVDKTFPDLAQKLRRDDSTSSATRETTMMVTMRQCEKKFYTDEIKLLLLRIEAINDKCSRQEVELAKLKSQHKIEKLSNHQSELQTWEDPQIEDNNKDQSTTSLVARLRDHHEVQIEKIKKNYEKKLKQKDKQKANACKALQFQHHCQIMQIRFAQEKLRKQKLECQTQLSSLKKKMQQIEQNLQKAGSNVGIEIESYKEQNALLRSFIYKVQLAEQQLLKLEQSRKKQRQQFVEYAEESQQEKRELLKQMQEQKSAYEQKIQLLSSELTLKAETIKQFSQKIEELQNDRRKGSQPHLSGKTSQVEWQKMQASFHKTTPKKQLKSSKVGSEADGPNNLQGNYYRQMQRLRIQRNHVALENNKMVQKISLLEEELAILKIRCQSQQFKSHSLKSKLSQFDIPQVQSHIKQEARQVESKVEDLQQNEIISELQQALKREEDKNRHMNQEYSVLHNYYKTKQNSMKLTLEMSENSYKQLWQKHCILLNSLKNEREEKQSARKALDEISLKLTSQQHQMLKQQKQKQLISVQCQTLRQKYETIKQQCNQIIKQSNEKLEQDQIILFRQKKELERCEKDVESLNNKIRSDFEQFQRERVKKNQQIQQLQALLNTKEESVQKYIERLEQSLALIKKQHEQALEEISKLKANPLTGKNYKPITTLFQQQGQEANNSTIAHYQQQICQINANHQNQIDHLKQYIHELVDENDELRENYSKAAQTWREMYQGVIRYNKFVDEGQLKLQSSTARKREIVEELENKGNFNIANMHSIKMVEEEQIIINETKMGKNDEAFQYPQQQNHSEVYTVPDFSECKQQSIETEKKPKCVYDEGKADESWGKNLRKNLESQCWGSKKQANLKQIIEQQENSDNSTRALLKRNKFN